MTQEKILENKKKILELLGKVKRDKMPKLIEWMCSNQCDFFVAPASTQFHLHVTGGLAQHSLNVYRALLRLSETFNMKLNEETMILTSILHDFCKIGLYKLHILKSGKVSPAKPYAVEDLFPVGHGEKSVIMIQNWIDLTEQEVLMIRWHYGMFDRSFNQYADKLWKVCPAAYMFFQADWMASLYYDDREDDQTWEHATPVMDY